ncbi:VanZ family protein [Nostoc flagelliforme FACHB-838]|uniref:VanZ family protein n=1 Tax=Nostoc flagelliforme FACHB-838 TaxID=2692904 RepID=A0ABR8E120_9NOSO|nr:VanZ family protein [Nostoc flagelliforme]MBD2535264.1 VanZ family protein [Nostoc flagelliforme FACHB-838]
MFLHNIITQTSCILSKLILNRSLYLVTASILAILIATLHPFNFLLLNNFSIQTITASFDNASSFEDLVNNILLFIPLGFSYTAFSQNIKIKPINKFITLIIISAGLSLTVEVLQIFLPSRSPTPADIANNTLGGIVGIICFYIWHSQSFIYILSSVENWKLSNSNKKIAILFLTYIVLSFLMILPWKATTYLSNWTPIYPLLLGNEATGDKPWRGYISDLHIADRSVSKNQLSELFDSQDYLNIFGDSLISSYQFTNKRDFQDNTRQLPELLPQGQSSYLVDSQGVALSSSYWLKTGTPTTLLNKRIRKNSQFTIITTVATADTNQIGPARIISISSGILRRNFTLGQRGNNLDLRIRTPITGENATDIKLSIPGIFAHTNTHNIVLTYSKANIQVYVDNVQNFYYFNLLELIPKEQKLLYYALTFIPLGICLTFITIIARKKLNFYRLLLPSGILLPSLILESILVIDIHKSISLTNILIGIFFTGGTMLILRIRASELPKKQF